MVKCQRCKKICKKGVIIRRKEVCGNCFALLNADNKERMKRNMKIPLNFELIINDIGYVSGQGTRRKRWRACRIII